MRRGRCRIVLLMLSAALLTGCRTTSFWPRAIPECPGALRPPAEIPGDVRLELSMRVRAESVDTALRLALEKRGDEITLIGLNALGAVVFSAIQTGAGVEIDALPAAVLEVPPKNVLRDLHRAFFIGIAPPPRDGEYREVRGDTRITERRHQGWYRVQMRINFVRNCARLDHTRPSH